MGTDHKEKLIRVLQILEETDEKSPMNATQILKYLEEEYQNRTGRSPFCLS